MEIPSTNKNVVKSGVYIGRRGGVVFCFLFFFYEWRGRGRIIFIFFFFFFFCGSDFILFVLSFPTKGRTGSFHKVNVRQPQRSTLRKWPRVFRIWRGPWLI